MDLHNNQTTLSKVRFTSYIVNPVIIFEVHMRHHSLTNSKIILMDRLQHHPQDRLRMRFPGTLTDLKKVIVILIWWRRLIALRFVWRWRWWIICLRLTRGRRWMICLKLVERIRGLVVITRSLLIYLIIYIYNRAKSKAKESFNNYNYNSELW